MLAGVMMVSLGVFRAALRTLFGPPARCRRPRDTPDDPLVEVFEELDGLGETVDSQVERDEVRDVRQALERLPGGRYVGNRIDRDTTRDVAEGFVGSIPLSLPLVVEDGVFDIADRFPAATVAGVPVWGWSDPALASAVSPSSGRLQPFAGPEGNSRDDATASARTWI